MSGRADTRFNRQADKATNEKHTAILKAMMKQPENKYCVDCKTAKDPRWASWNLGCFMCIRCSGMHRSLGTHISKVKSADLDSWTPEQIECIQKWGNYRANAYWEANCNEKPTESNIERFIRKKYEQKAFVSQKEVPDPDTIPLPGQSQAIQQKQPARQDTSSPASLFDSSTPPPATSQQQQKKPTASDDLFAAFQTPPPSNPTPPPAANNSAKMDIMSLYNSSPAKPTQTSSPIPQQQNFASFGTFAAFNNVPASTASQTSTSQSQNLLGGFQPQGSSQLMGGSGFGGNNIMNTSGGFNNQQQSNIMGGGFNGNMMNQQKSSTSGFGSNNNMMQNMGPQNTMHMGNSGYGSMGGATNGASNGGFGQQASKPDAFAGLGSLSAFGAGKPKSNSANASSEWGDFQ